MLVDHVLANSDLTAEHLASAGYTPPTTVFRNAAPAAFFGPFRPRPAKPRRILVVSNHADPALTEAVAILRRSVAVEWIGVGGGEKIALVTPETIAAADLVVAIGKTIPYALAGRVPVYVYDHFGGPGYLDRDNADRAMRYNFSGRCCERKLSGREIAAEIIGRYDQGIAFARDVPQDWIDQFDLPRYLSVLLDPALASNAEKRRRMAEAPFLKQERMLADYVRESHIHRQQTAIRLWQLERQLRGATKP